MSNDFNQIVPDAIPTPYNFTAFHTGPGLDQGPLPTWIYFALNGKDSLTLDPFNQPVAALKNQPIRTISFTLPAHEDNKDPNLAIFDWFTQLSKNPNYINDFIDQCVQSIDFLIEQEIISPHHFAVGGLSRGAFIACHLAAKIPAIKSILGFAPMTFMRSLKEFEDTPSEYFNRLDLINLTDSLYNRNVRFYIGNRDLRVSTAQCFRFIDQLANTAYDKGIRSSPIEMFVGPSIGHKGHGTSPQIFQDGASWVLKQLTSKKSDQG